VKLRSPEGFTDPERVNILLINPLPVAGITDLFLDTGLDQWLLDCRARAVRISHQANPQDRRFLIEEAAGIAK